MQKKLVKGKMARIMTEEGGDYSLRLSKNT